MSCIIICYNDVDGGRCIACLQASVDLNLIDTFQQFGTSPDTPSSLCSSLHANSRLINRRITCKTKFIALQPDNQRPTCYTRSPICVHVLAFSCSSSRLNKELLDIKLLFELWSPGRYVFIWNGKLIFWNAKISSKFPSYATEVYVQHHTEIKALRYVSCVVYSPCSHKNGSDRCCKWNSYINTCIFSILSCFNMALK